MTYTRLDINLALAIGTALGAWLWQDENVTWWGAIILGAFTFVGVSLLDHLKERVSAWALRKREALAAAAHRQEGAK